MNFIPETPHSQTWQSLTQSESSMPLGGSSIASSCVGNSLYLTCNLYCRFLCWFPNCECIARTDLSHFRLKVEFSWYIMKGKNLHQIEKQYNSLTVTLNYGSFGRIGQTSYGLGWPVILLMKKQNRNISIIYIQQFTTHLEIISIFKKSGCFFHVVPSNIAYSRTKHPPLVIKRWLSLPIIRPAHSSILKTNFPLSNCLFFASFKALDSFLVTDVPNIM